MATWIGARAGAGEAEREACCEGGAEWCEWAERAEVEAARGLVGASIVVGAVEEEEGSAGGEVEEGLCAGLA